MTRYGYNARSVARLTADTPPLEGGEIMALKAVLLNCTLKVARGLAY